MHTVEHLHEALKLRLKPKRYSHSVAVLETAIKLSKRYHVSEKETVWASLLHDYAKNLNDHDMELYILHYGLEVDPVIRSRINLAHGIVGAELACEEFHIKNENILNAIRNHTFGRAGMTDLEKVIYMADFIEPARHFKGVQKLRDMAFKDLDKAMLMALEHTISHIIGSRRLLHPNTVMARNYFVQLEDENGAD